MTYDPGTSTVNDMDADHVALGGSVVGVIRVRSGAYIDLFDPTPDVIHIQDIAHALSMVCRFGGHTATHYSVAEHSLHVASQLERQYRDPRLTLAGLLHDAEEAYTGDMVRPLKHDPSMAMFRAVGDTLHLVIHDKFGVLDLLDDPRIKAIDNEILPWEMAMIRDCEWRVPPAPDVVRRAFLDRFHALRANAKETP